MKKQITLFLLLLVWTSLYAQHKVKEQSHKEKPTWVNGTVQGFLVVSATAPTIEEAKEKILVTLRDQVSRSVATQITSGSTLESQQHTDGDQIRFDENMTSYVISKTTNIPFIKEISLTKAQDYYWEKLYNKQTKTYFYEYQIKYQLSSFELKRMVKEFNERESELSRRLDDYRTSVNGMQSVEEIDQTLNELKGFAAEFAADDSRRAQTNSLIGSYLDLYNHILVDEAEQGKGYLLIRLLIGERQIGCARKPVIRSNCATKFSVQPQGDGTFRVGFDDFNCYEDDENFLEVRFSIGDKSVFKKCFIEHKAEE